MGHFHPVILFVFRRHPYIVRVFQGFAFLLHVISSSFFTREYWNHTISFTNSATKPMLQKHVWTLQVHTVQSFVLCVVSFHFMVLYTIQLLKNLVLHFLPPPLDSRLLFSPCRSFPFFLLSARDPISQSIHSRRSYELQITASRFMRSLIV